MNKTAKKIFKSLLLTSLLSVITTGSKAKNSLLPEAEFDDNDTDKINELKSKVIKNVIKINRSGEAVPVNSHRSHSSHSSHRSHYSSSGGHSSHSSHYSSSHASHYSSSSSGSSSSKSTSSTANGLYSAPKTKTPADYSLGDRSSSNGTFGQDVTLLADLLVEKYYLRKDKVSKKSGYAQYNADMSQAVKHFQRDASLPVTGTADNTTVLTLQTWDKIKTTVDLGIREIKDGVFGYDVSVLVKLLSAAGYAPEASKIQYKSGFVVFDKEISTAVKMFQAYNKLNVTGKADTPTLNKLKTFQK